MLSLLIKYEKSLLQKLLSKLQHFQNIKKIDAKWFVSIANFQ